MGPARADWSGELGPDLPRTPGARKLLAEEGYQVSLGRAWGRGKGSTKQVQVGAQKSLLHAEDGSLGLPPPPVLVAGLRVLGGGSHSAPQDL